MTVSWPHAERDFAPDGSLRDVYVFQTGLGNWDAVLAHLRDRYAPLTFMIDGSPASLPASAAEAFAIRAEGSPLLTFCAGGVHLACHFFTPEEVELDLLPQHVNGPERLASVVELLRGVAIVTGKVVVLTAENRPDAIILRADPVTGSVVYEPPADAPAV